MTFIKQSSQAHIVPFCDKAIEIIYQDDYIVVINKPEPLLSTPGRLPENHDSALVRLQKQYPAAELVHRLDMATSGLMVIALNKLMTRNLSIQFQKRLVKKTYLAVLDGSLEQDTGQIDLPIITDWENRPKQKIDFQTGKASLTHYQVLERYPNQTSRVLFTPITGRSHQLRIHSLAIGHPILGCHLYAKDGSEEKSPRLLLHANYLAFTHPYHNRDLEFHCPADF